MYIQKPLGGKKLSWFTSTKIREWHSGLTKLQKQKGPKGKTISPTTANRALTLLSTVFNQGAPDVANPCIGVKKFKETSRERFLHPDELQRFFTALEDPVTPQNFKDYIILSLFTGARRSNILAMRWKDIDLESRTWTIPAKESKSGQAMMIPLVDQALVLLIERKAQTRSIFVLPSKTSKTGHYREPRKAWEALLRRAELKDTRLHDLRRTMGSYMAISGSNLPSISKALGHQNQATTAVYARLDLDPVRAGMEKAAEAMLATRRLPGNVVKLSNDSE
nr:site-specific integrase [Desulfogranum marinum]